MTRTASDQAAWLQQKSSAESACRKKGQITARDFDRQRFNPRQRGTIMPKQSPVRPQDHWEAVRLSWKARHIPIGTILVSGLALASVLSAVVSIFVTGPAQGIP
jgi:hypothetical protein